jgi:hypothetical protein
VAVAAVAVTAAVAAAVTVVVAAVVTVVVAAAAEVVAAAAVTKSFRQLRCTNDFNTKRARRPRKWPSAFSERDAARR